MKNHIYSLILILVLSSCSTDNGNKDKELVGEWKLIEILFDPGDGSGTFNPVESEKKVEFKANGIYVSNGTLCFASIESNGSSSGTYSASELTISPSVCESMNDLSFEINGSYLL